MPLTTPKIPLRIANDPRLFDLIYLLDFFILTGQVVIFDHIVYLLVVSSKKFPKEWISSLT